MLEAVVGMDTVLPGSTGPIDCWAARRRDWGDGFGADPDQVLFVAPTPAGRGLFLLRVDDRPASGLRSAEPVEGPALPDGKITACAASRNALYLALRDRGIQKVELSRELQSVARRSRFVSTLGPRFLFEGPNGPVNPVAMVVGPVRPDWDSTWEALYVVAGDEAIYRFDENLKPDVRLKPGGHTGR